MTTSTTILLALLALNKPQMLYAKDDLPISITGNERTQSSYIEHLARRCIADYDASEGLDPSTSLRQCLINTQLFSDVKAAITSDSITVKVDERWTLIPIPYAQSDTTGNNSEGLFVLESNFLGIGQLAGGGFAFSNRGNSYFAFLQDKSLFQTPWTASLFVSDTSQDVPFYKPKLEIFDGFAEDKNIVGLSVGYRISDQTSVAIESHREQSRYKTWDLYSLRPDDKEDATLGTRLRIGKTDYRLFFQEGATCEVSYSKQFLRTGIDTLESQAKVTGTVAWAVNTVDALRATISAGKIVGGDETDLFRLGGQPGFRGIPTTGVWAEAYMAATSDYLIPVHDTSYGMWTVAGFAEAGRLQPWRGITARPIDYATYGAGGYLFLKKLAVPGIGLEIGHNNRYQAYFATVSFGLSFN